MTFARPDWLWLLVPAALCLGFAWTAGRRRRAVAKGWPALAARPGRRVLKSACFICAVAALALAAAGPRLGIGKPDATSKTAPRLRLLPQRSTGSRRGFSDAWTGCRRSSGR